MSFPASYDKCNCTLVLLSEYQFNLKNYKIFDCNFVYIFGKYQKVHLYIQIKWLGAECRCLPPNTFLISRVKDYRANKTVKQYYRPSKILQVKLWSFFVFFRNFVKRICSLLLLTNSADKLWLLASGKVKRAGTSNTWV